MSKIKEKIIVLSILFAFLCISVNVSGYEGAEPIWTDEDWNLKGPNNIHSPPVPSHASNVLYLTGDNGDGVSNFYSVDLSSGSPEPRRMPIEGMSTSSPRVYPESRDDNYILRQWEERVYFVTDNGTIYRVEGDTLELGWRYDISEFENQESVTYTPVIHETEDSIILVFITDNSMHAIEDYVGTEGPKELWKISLERNLTYHQPEVVRSMGGRETTAILTTTCGIAMAVDMKGDILWELQMEDSISRPVVPLNILMGQRSELFFFTTGESNLNRIPVKDHVVIEDVESMHVTSNYTLQTPLISEDGNIIWVAAVSGTHSIIHYIELEKSYKDDDYTEWRKHEINDRVVGELAHMEQKSLLIVLTSSGWLHGLISDPTTNRVQWEFQLHSSSNPDLMLILSRNLSPHFIDHVVMVVFAEDHGSEAWDLFNTPTDMSFLYGDLDDLDYLYDTDDSDEADDSEGSIDRFFSICFLSLSISWVIVVAIILSIFILRRKKDQTQYPPYYRQ